MDADSGGVVVMVPLYAVSQAVAPRAKSVQATLIAPAFQLERSWSKALADYITATDGWPRGVSVNASRGRATEKKEWGGTRTLNM